MVTWAHRTACSRAAWANAPRTASGFRGYLDKALGRKKRGAYPYGFSGVTNKTDFPEKGGTIILGHEGTRCDAANRELPQDVNGCDSPFLWLS